MIGFLTRVFLTSALASSVVAASSVDCIISDLHAVQKQTECLGHALSLFNHCGTSCLSVYHDLRPLSNIYRLSCELDALLENTIEDVQHSCPFSDNASQQIALALTQIEPPLTATLNEFSAKEIDFLKALGPHLTHKVVGESLRQTRHLTLNLLRSVNCKIEAQYKTLIETAASDINKQFNAVISKY